MQQSHKLKKFSPDVLLLSYFYVGFLPKAPGTWGSLFTIPLIYFLSLLPQSYWIILAFTIVMTIIACYRTNVVQKQYHLHDPQWIVIDEVLGMLTTFLFFPTFSLLNIALLFSLFRFFDIVKIWPASFFDKKVKHGAGTILDDIVSGVFAGMSLKLIQTVLI